MSALRQSVSHSVYAESKDFLFPHDVPSGDLLLCSVISRDVVLDVSPGTLWNRLGYAADLGFASIAISTPGLTWVLLGTCDTNVTPFLRDMEYASCTSRITVYAAFNVAGFSTTVPTTVTSSGGYSGLDCALWDFQTDSVVTEVSTITSRFQNGSLIGPPSAGDLSWSTDEPAYPITAGLVATNPGDLLVVISTAEYSYVFAGPGAYDAPGFTHGPADFWSDEYFNQYLASCPGGLVDTLYRIPPVQAFAAIAFTFAAGAPGASGGGGAITGCGKCNEPPFLSGIHGFSDLPNSVLTAGSPAFALHLGEISDNAAFGMVRCEVFPCTMKHGDVIPLPVSCADGYAYSREELLYLWTVPNTCDPSTNWISGPDSLWFANWNVDQVTGTVFSEEWYERSSTADSRLAAKSNDGSVLVFTIGQRQKTNMIMAALANYTAISEADIATDKPLTEALIQALNDDAKFSVVNSEVFYLGEYTDGQTVTLPISPVDGYTYSAAECGFIHCWRWTPLGSAYTQPGASVTFWVPGLDQAGPFSASVSSGGLCTIVVNFSSSGGEGETTPTGYGRIAVFAFAQRSATPASSPLANNFTELDVGFFFPGESVRASTILTIKRNIDEAILSPEFFGPTVYHDGDTVGLPTSPVDGYVYKRAEIHPIWSWADTTNNLGGGHVRLPFFLGSVDLTTGHVSLKTWRLPPGGPYVDDCNTQAKIIVIVMANRQGSHPELIPAPSATNTPDDAGTFVADVTTRVYSVGAFISGFPTSSQLIFRVILPDAVTFAAGLASSTADSAAAATATAVFSVRKNGTEFGTVTFAASSAVGTFAAASLTSFNGTTDILSLVGPSSIDASLANIGIVLRGTR